MNSQEKALRAQIRKAIKVVQNKKNGTLKEEKEFRKHIRRLIAVERTLLERSIPDNETPPSKSTGINVLADLLRNIIPTIKNDYVKATSSPEERKSFRSHIINAIEKSLVNVKTNKDAGDDKDELDEEINVQVSDEDGDGNEDEEKFIDIRQIKRKKMKKALLIQKMILVLKECHLLKRSREETELSILTTLLNHRLLMLTIP